MKSLSIKLLSLFALIIFTVNCANENRLSKSKSPLRLWYQQPAEKWVEALPIGNGRLGAMVYGRVDLEIIQLNEESLWAGSKINNNNPGSAKHLKKIQRLLLQGESLQAAKLAEKYMLGTPPRIRSYQTLGELHLDFLQNQKNALNYKRELDLSDGLSRVSYELNGIRYTREMFASAPDNAIIIHLSADQKRELSFAISLTREKDARALTDGDNTLLLNGQIMDEDNVLSGPGGAHMKFAARLRVINNGGTVSAEKNRLLVKNADDVTLLLTAATDYNPDSLNFDRSIQPQKVCGDIIEKALSFNYPTLKKRHTAEHSALFNRVSLYLGESGDNNLPTDKRLMNVKNGAEDAGLIALYFQYGRYLLMDSSRPPGVLPANLQGLWNKDLNAPWNSDFHTNINLQMNYWPADVCNLPETLIPLTNFFYKLMKPGSATAKEMYNARGWTLHHLTDPFGRTGLMDGIGWGTSPLAGSWMALTFWRHYLFTMDENYLRGKAWPIMKGAARFVLDFLIEDGNGHLVTAPSLSPENKYIDPVTGKNLGFTYGATIDIEIINELFGACVKAAEILKTDGDFVDEMKEALRRLPPVRIGKDGTVMEWIKDYEETDPGHRHMSHLFALYPGTQITDTTPELFSAAAKTIEKRLANGGGHTGWSRAWIINFYARLFDGENAYKHLLALLRKSTLSNLFDNHPPFQIDGNFGGTAGIAEMLLQSHNGIVRILPALPKEWPQGYVKGLKARGNFTVDINWEKDTLSKLRVHSGSGGSCKIRYKNTTITLDTQKGKDYHFDGNLKLIK